MALLNFAVVDKHSSREDKLIRIVGDLLGAVGGESSGGKINTIFDLIKKSFNGEIWIVRFFECDIVVLEVRGRDASLLSIQMV
jgi:hypothetical protein